MEDFLQDITQVAFEDVVKMTTAKTPVVCSEGEKKR